MNWLKRTPASRPKCGNCRFFVDRGKQGDQHIQECHADPPVIIGWEATDDNKSNHVMVAWPETEASEWCGRHEKDKAP